MVWVIINDDLVAIPQPAIAEPYVVRRHAEVESTEPKPTRTAPFEPEHMAGPKTARKASVLKWMVEVVVCIVRTGIVSGPPTVRFNVRSIRVSRLV